MSEMKNDPVSNLGGGSFTNGDTRDGISLLDVLVVLVKNSKIVVRTTLYFIILGLMIAIFSPAKYTASADVIGEAESQSLPGGLGGLSVLRGLGINLGSSRGLTPEIYPAILKSQEVQLAIIREHYFLANEEEEITYVDYLTESTSIVSAMLAMVLDYTVGLPGKIIRAFKAGDRNEISRPGAASYVILSEEEDDALKSLNEITLIKTDLPTSIITISVTTPDPYLSAQMVTSYVHHLTQRVQEMHTRKTREDLEFIKEQFAQAQGELEEAETALANFLDQNRDPQTARLKTEMERFERQMRFKSELYMDLQTQRTQAEIDLQRSRPVITILEAPTPPLLRSAPKRKVIVVLSLIMGFGVGILLAFTAQFIAATRDDELEGPKLSQIWKALVPARLAKRWQAD